MIRGIEIFIEPRARVTVVRGSIDPFSGNECTSIAGDLPLFNGSAQQTECTFYGRGAVVFKCTGEYRIEVKLLVARGNGSAIFAGRSRTFPFPGNLSSRFPFSREEGREMRSSRSKFARSQGRQTEREGASSRMQQVREMPSSSPSSPSSTALRSHLPFCVAGTWPMATSPPFVDHPILFRLPSSSSSRYRFRHRDFRDSARLVA